MPGAARVFPAAAFLFFAPALTGPAVGDVIVLKAGGELRGEFVGEPGRGPALTLRTRAGATVSVRREEVRRWAYRDAGREAFERRFDRTPPDAAAWWALAEWALANRLRSERERALHRVIALDPNHEPARLALGHKRDRGEWLSAEQWRRRKGLVLYGRRLVSPEEKALLEKADARDDAEQTWFKQVRLWQRALRTPGRAGAARVELGKVTDPAAIPALRKFLADDPDVRVRTLYVQVIARLPDVEPVPALADQAVRDVDGEVRDLAVRALAEPTAPHAGPERAGLAQELLRRGLRDDENLTVRRAASALAAVGDANAVPDLIRSLITTHHYKVVVRDNSGAAVSLGPGGSVRGGLGGGGGGLSPEALLALRAQYPGATFTNRPPPPGPVRRVTVKVEHRNPEALLALRAILTRSAPTAANGTLTVAPPPVDHDEAAWAAWWDRNRAGFAAG